MIDSGFLEDIKPINIGYSPKFFYIWGVLKYGFNKKTQFKNLMSYGVSKRQVIRYLNDLESEGMISRTNHGRNGTIIQFL